MNKFSLKEQTFFAKRLSFLINAGIPLVESIEMLANQALSKEYKRVLMAVQQDVMNGQSLSKSFAKFPKIFNEFSIHIIKVGEAGGMLSQNLEYLADELKKRQALHSKVVGASIYPAIITLATLGITLFLTAYLFPKITPVFMSLQVSLPPTTRAMMAASTFVTTWGMYVAFGGILFFLACPFILARSLRLRTLSHRVLLRVPLFGKMVRFYHISNICRTLGLLLSGGLRLSEALVVTADTTKNLIYKKECLGLAQSVERGEALSTYLAGRTALFPDMVGHMLAVGERSGTLPETLVYVSSMYDHEVEDFTKNLATLVEPALMIVMGLLVGFIAISIITPIYGITQNLHQ